MNDESTAYAQVPMQWIGPVKITGPVVDEEVEVPLATYEKPLWPSTNRGARVSVHAGGIRAVVMDDRMTRSILLETPNAEVSLRIIHDLPGRRAEMDAVVAAQSRFATLLDWHVQTVANLLFIRFEFQTGDASGHNMATAAADHLMRWMQETYPELTYVSISGNYCTDKKVSAVNGILGRGRHVITEMNVPRRIVERFLKSTPEKIVDLNIKKNLIGSIVSGGLRTANAHFANILLAFYLATGQDAANLVEGSQGFVHAEVRNDDLYISATLPHLIVGAVGSGKDLVFAEENLARLGCKEKREPGENAKRLAVIAAAATLCGELSLLAALTNPGELMEAHTRIERS